MEQYCSPASQNVVFITVNWWFHSGQNGIHYGQKLTVRSTYFTPWHDVMHDVMHDIQHDVMHGGLHEVQHDVMRDVQYVGLHDVQHDVMHVVLYGACCMTCSMTRCMSCCMAHAAWRAAWRYAWRAAWFAYDVLHVDKAMPKVGDHGIGFAYVKSSTVGRLIKTPIFR